MTHFLIYLDQMLCKREELVPFYCYDSRYFQDVTFDEIQAKKLNITDTLRLFPWSNA